MFLSIVFVNEKYSRETIKRINVCLYYKHATFKANRVHEVANTSRRKRIDKQY